MTKAGDESAFWSGFNEAKKRYAGHLGRDLIGGEENSLFVNYFRNLLRLSIPYNSVDAHKASKRKSAQLSKERE